MVGKFKQTRHTQTIFKWILLPMCILVLVETLFLGQIIIKGEVMNELVQNEKDIVREKLINRKNYIQNEMVGQWSNLSELVRNINSKADEAERENQIDLNKIDQGSDSCLPLLESVSEDLIDAMRKNSVNGVFMILNNENLGEAGNGEYQDKPGVYLRDTNPTANASIRNNDLLMMRGPVALVNSLGIATDNEWRPQFEFGQENKPYYAFLQKPYEQGTTTMAKESLTQAGYWSAPYVLDGDNKEAIAYSLPLITSDGRIYGVVGIEMLTEYIQTLLPADEIMESGTASYLLAVDSNGEGVYQNVALSGQMYPEILVKEKKITLEKDDEHGVRIAGQKQKEDYFASVQYMTLYDTNTPFVNQKWTIMAIVDAKEISTFSKDIINIILFSILLTIIIGIVGSFLVSYAIARPIKKLATEMKEWDPRENKRLTKTGIKEIDGLKKSIESLSFNIIESATKFTQILNLASVKIAGYELDMEKYTFFATDNFFELFGLWDIDIKALTVEEFTEALKLLEPYRQEEVSDRDGAIFKVLFGEGTHYIKLKEAVEDTRRIGLAEDVTGSVVEKRMIEHERDHDLLTGLKNRRAFNGEMNRLFAMGESVLKTAALVMIDLDNLKKMNDTYGHEWGDKYIRHVAEAFLKCVPKNTVVSRISGDEFYLFFYGYDSESAIKQVVNEFKEGVGKEALVLANGGKYQVRMSGGIAWYAKETMDYEKLLQYSDFAMYQVKKGVKGDIKEFDMEIYNQEMSTVQNKIALSDMIEHQSVEYYFQPIVSAETGEIFGYEALMRGNIPALRSPMDILALAKMDYKLKEIETLTWTKAMEYYARHVEQGEIRKGCKVFINSLPEVCMEMKDSDSISEKYGEYLQDIVLELTEEERIDDNALSVKLKTISEWKAKVALDDYGSGYNSETVLLSIAPQYVKIDKEIIRNIHKDADKQKIVGNLVSYASEREMFVVAEGVECAQEVETVIRLGVGYLQGYYLARPEFVPPDISNVVQKQIREWSADSKKKTKNKKRAETRLPQTR